MEFLCDKYLINNCKALKDEFPAFIVEDSNCYINLKKLLNSFDSEGNITTEKYTRYHDLWKDLLNDAITFLKHNDTREHYGKKDNLVKPERDQVAFGIDDLYKYFKKYGDFEALLYGADKFYRDHITHLFRVWFLGLWLIEKFGNNIHWDVQSLIEQNKDLTESLAISKDEVSAMWCLIALTHDLGYPLDKAEKVRTKIDAMMSYFGGIGASSADFQIPSHHHFINDFILQFISSKLTTRKNPDSNNILQTSKQSKFYLKFSKSLENFKHGIVTCILLMKNLVYFLESDLDLTKTFKDAEDARQFYIRREILRSIASHTCTDIYHLFPNSLSFILILADELQVWGRPTFTEMKRGQQLLKLRAKEPNILISQKNNKIELEFEIEEIETLDDEDDEDEGAEKYFFDLCKKWHKWLRSALDNRERKFDFYFKAKIKSKKKEKIYLFENKPHNIVKIYVDDKEEKLSKLLYS